MSVKAELARSYFMKGHSCCQSVAAAFSNELGLSEEQVLRMTSGFGAGFGRMREVCGTFSGVTLVISALYGRPDPAGKAETYAIIQELARQFKEKSGGSIVCRELLGLKQAEGTFVPQKRTAEYYQKRPCPELVAMAAELVETYIQTHPTA